MGLFSNAQIEQINSIAAKSNEALKPASTASPKSINNELNRCMDQVLDYFSDSPAINITTEEQLHNYIDKCIEFGYAGIDTETTGLDRLNDTIVGASLYTEGLPEGYIPIKHLIPIFDEPYKGQLSYEQVGREFQRLVDNNVKLIFANADFDIAMIYKDIHVDLIPACYYDVIGAWRCLKENEPDNALKVLYAKYPMHGKIDAKKFSDFFSPKLFPYCKPEVAKLYAANDAKITFDLFKWQLPYVTKSSQKCQKASLDKISDLVWNIEMPMISVCAMLHRVGVFIDQSISRTLHDRYTAQHKRLVSELSTLVQEWIDKKDTANNRNRPFRTGAEFNPNSPVHVKYLINTLMGIQTKSTDKEQLTEINQPVTNKILEVRAAVKLIGTYVDKLPQSTDSSSRIHATFRSIGADTGRMSSSDPNLQNIPSHATDIRHMFRATPRQHELVSVKGEIELPGYCKLEEVSGEWKRIRDIAQGDEVKVYPGGSILVSSAHKCESEYKICFASTDAPVKLNVRYPEYVMMSSDYSQQEPKLTAFASQEKKMIKTFQEGKDIYATIASVAYKVPYEDCLEFHPVTHENQPEGKARRSVGKVLVLGINYGMSIESIAQDLFGTNTTMTDEEKTKKAEQIFNAVMEGFPDLRDAISSAQYKATKLGYTETITGRRRHHPNMQLPPYQFRALPGYVNPDIDPLDPSTLTQKDEIPKRITDELLKKLTGLKYFGQRVKLIKQLREEHIEVIDNTRKIQEASRQVWNAVIQGSAADLTKMAMLRLCNDPEWKEIGGRLLIPVHDELIVEVPFDEREKGAQILKRSMEGAGEFLPFPIYCDIEETFRWYGLGVDDILEFDKPNNLVWESLSDSNIKWLQCMLSENEYILPRHPSSDGSKLIGLPAKGIDGVMSAELKQYCEDYMLRYHVSESSFLDHIETKVISGVY